MATALTSKRLFILVATGRTGRELVDQARVREHPVTALVRAPQKLGAARESLTVVQGDLLTPLRMAPSALPLSSM